MIRNFNSEARNIKCATLYDTNSACWFTEVASQSGMIVENICHVFTEKTAYWRDWGVLSLGGAYNSSGFKLSAANVIRYSKHSRRILGKRPLTMLLSFPEPMKVCFDPLDQFELYLEDPDRNGTFFKFQSNIGNPEK